MKVWKSDKSYLVFGGKDFNLVLSHHVDHFTDKVEDLEMKDFTKTI
jgi:salicylate hydroxylase